MPTSRDEYESRKRACAISVEEALARVTDASLSDAERDVAVKEYIKAGQNRTNWNPCAHASVNPGNSEMAVKWRS